MMKELIESRMSLGTYLEGLYCRKGELIAEYNDEIEIEDTFMICYHIVKTEIQINILGNLIREGCFV